MTCKTPPFKTFPRLPAQYHQRAVLQMASLPQLLLGRLLAAKHHRTGGVVHAERQAAGIVQGSYLKDQLRRLRWV